jgi:nuclear pore complex protein Nup93
MASGGFGGSLFGGNKGSSILGTGQPAQAGTSSLFSTNQQPIQQQSQPQQAPQNPLPPLAQSTQSAQATQPAFFNSLLERGKKRPFATGSQDSYGELPSLQLGLDDIRRKARELGGQDTKAARQPGRDQKA